MRKKGNPVPEVSSTEVFAGIDVGKDSLVVALTSGKPQTFENSKSGRSKLVQWLITAAPVRVVLEATGGYERHIYAALGAASLPAVIVQPAQARHFAKATGKLEKTDAIDAMMLAEFARAIRPQVREVPSEKAVELNDLSTRYDQLTDMLSMEKTRLKQAPNATIKRNIEAHIEFLERMQKKVCDQIDAIIAQSPKWTTEYDILRSVKGVGPVLARKLIASLPELGKLSRQKIAKLVGLAPISRDSGSSSGKRFIAGGRADVRSKLYMSVVATLRYDGMIKAYYDRLRTAGKPAKLAITACMRKLITLLNALLRKQLPFKNPVPAT